MVDYDSGPGKLMSGLIACVECDGRQFFVATPWEDTGEGTTPALCAECGAEYLIPGRHTPI